MTIRHLVEVDTDALERMAFAAERDIEIDTARGRAFLRINNITYTAPLPQEVTC